MYVVCTILSSEKRSTLAKKKRKTPMKKVPLGERLNMKVRRNVISKDGPTFLKAMAAAAEPQPAAETDDDAPPWAD